MFHKRLIEMPSRWVSQLKERFVQESMYMNSLLVWDRSALYWINNHHYPWLDAILAPISFFGEYDAIWLGICALMLALNKPGYRPTAITLLLALLVTNILIVYPLHHLFFRLRPYESLQGIRQWGIRWHEGSFPSGHAYSSWLSVSIIGSCFTRFKFLLGIFAVLTCYSRPYLGMHYPSDVIAGALIGYWVGYGAVILEQRRYESGENRL